MTYNSRDLSSIIRANISKAKEILDSKDKSISMLLKAFSEINSALNNKLEFILTDTIDNEGDEITNVSISNIINGYREHLLWYYFNPEEVFPAMFNYQNIITARCDDISEVDNFIERLISNHAFMIRVITISEIDRNQ